ncbi:MAG: malate dehydrogenase [Candidatus Bathyarchaeota archaeon]|nr:malate dehydrogenase [Candidatus Bathyarchaeota archaeon]
MITVIGAGKVGSAAAFDILRYRISDVVLIDTNEKAAMGEALDMMQAAPAIEFDGTIRGTSDFSAMKDSELVIVTAGVGRRPDMTRFDLMNVNAEIVRGVVHEVAKYAPKTVVMVVTNPVDIMTYLSFKETGFPRSRLFGMGNILDSMRFRTYIAQELGVSREDTRALVIGEHGDSMVPLVEYASVSGIPITKLLSPTQIEGIVKRTVSSGADVIKLKGGTVYAPGAAIAVTADAILTGRNRVMSVSTCLEDEYTQSCVSIGVPVVLGKDGVEKIIELDLSNDARLKFERSVAAVKQAIAELKINP